MPDLGDLKHLLKDESNSLADLDWLKVDEEDYREFAETLPKQNIDAVPDLKEQWASRKDTDAKYNLSPTNKRPEKNTSFWSENDTKTGISENEKAEIVERFLKRKMTAGKSAKDALELLKNEFSGETLKTARPRIKSAIKEEGLLGRVYIDSTLFSDCDQGQGQDFARKHASDAKFVLGKDDCHDCVFNKNGVCSRFQKEIVFDVEYDQDIWEFYKRKFEEEGRDLSHVDDNASPREKIKQASKAPRKNKTDGKLDRKPVKDFPADKITTNEAEEVVSDMDVKREILDDVYQERKEREAARKMMASSSSNEPLNPTLEEQINSDPDLESLSRKANLLGPLYVDLSYFGTTKEAKNFFDENDINLDDKVVVGTPKESDDRGKTSPLTTKKALNRVLHRYAVSNFGKDYSDRVPLLRKIGKRLLKDKEKLRKFAQGVFSEPLPEDTQVYDATGQTIYNPSDDISEEEAWEQLEKMSADIEKADKNASEVTKRNKIAQKMMERDYHEDDLVEMIYASDSDLVSSLKKHIHLLGSLYTDSSFFDSKKAYQGFLDDNPDLKELPDRGGEDLSDFLRKDFVRELISKRLARFDEKELPDREALSSRGLHGLAQTVFSKSPKTESKEYEGRVYKTKGQVEGELSSLTEKEAQKIIASFDDPSEKVQDFNLKSLVSRVDNGKEILDKLASRFGKGPLKTFYLNDDTVTASKIENNREGMRKILASTLSSDFNPSGLQEFPGELTDTKVGEWMRNAYLKGKHGENLTNGLKTAFSNQKLLESAPVISLFREEEGLYGRTYVTADSFEGCVRGKKNLPDTVDQIVKTDKCKDCIHNRQSSCGLYQRKLVDEPEYNSETVQKALKNRLMNGELTRREAKAIQNADLPWKEKTRIAHTGKVEVQDQKISAPYSGYYGDTNKDIPVKKEDIKSMIRFAAKKAESGKYDKYGLKKLISSQFPPEIIQKGSNGIKKVLSRMEEPDDIPNVVDHDSSESPTGIEMLDEFDMTSSADPMEEVEIREDNQEDKMSGVSLDGGFSIDID